MVRVRHPAGATSEPLVDDGMSVALATWLGEGATVRDGSDVVGVFANGAEVVRAAVGDDSAEAVPVGDARVPAEAELALRTAVLLPESDCARATSTPAVSARTTKSKPPARCRPWPARWRAFRSVIPTPGRSVTVREETAPVPPGLPKTGGRVGCFSVIPVPPPRSPECSGTKHGMVRGPVHESQKT